MDWNLAVERNLEALKRLLAMLISIVATVDEGSAGGQFTFFVKKDIDVARSVEAEKSKLSPALTLPRHLHRFVLRLLRPTESATRRLIIIAARGLVVKVRPWRPRAPVLKKPPLNRKNGYGTGIVIRPGSLPDWARDLMPKRAPSLSLPLLDTLPRYGFRRRNVRPAIAPRIRLLGADPINPLFHRPEPLPPAPPTPDDPLDATRIRYRLEAISRALNDLPGQAQRMARWAARRDARLARERGEAGEAAILLSCRGDQQLMPRGSAVGMSGRTAIATLPNRRACHQRLSPMRPGRPPWLPQAGEPRDVSNFERTPWSRRTPEGAARYILTSGMISS